MGLEGVVHLFSDLYYLHDVTIDLADEQGNQASVKA